MGRKWGLAALTGLVIIGVGCLSTQEETELRIVDLHFHWEGEAPLDELIARNADQGVKLGIAGEGGSEWGLSADDSLEGYLAQLEGKPVYRGLQVYGLDWPGRYSREVLSKLDYVSADALLFPDTDGRVIALWTPEVAFSDAEDFMERYVQYNLEVISGPVNIWCNPTFLPEPLQADYDALWTSERMDRVIDAAVTNQVAIEINSKYRIPSSVFVKRAKERGARFAFGSNRHDDEPGDLDHCLEVYRECGLTPADLYVPAGVRIW